MKCILVSEEFFERELKNLCERLKARMQEDASRNVQFDPVRLAVYEVQVFADLLRKECGR